MKPRAMEAIHNCQLSLTVDANFPRNSIINAYSKFYNFKKYRNANIAMKDSNA